MKRLNVLQRLWIVAFIPWVIVNFWAINNESPIWMLGYWELIEDLWYFVFPGQIVGLMVVVEWSVFAAACLVSYVVLYCGAKLSWRAARWVRAGFADR